MQGVVAFLITSLCKLPRNRPMKKNSKSVIIWQNCGHEFVASTLFGSPCIILYQNQLDPLNRSWAVSINSPASDRQTDGQTDTGPQSYSTLADMHYTAHRHVLYEGLNINWFNLVQFGEFTRLNNRTLLVFACVSLTADATCYCYKFRVQLSGNNISETIRTLCRTCWREVTLHC